MPTSLITAKLEDSPAFFFVLLQIQQGMERLRMAAPDVFNSMGLPSLQPGLLPPSQAAAATTNGGTTPGPSSPAAPVGGVGSPAPGSAVQADAFSQFMTQVLKADPNHFDTNLA